MDPLGVEATHNIQPKQIADLNCWQYHPVDPSIYPTDIPEMGGCDDPEQESIKGVNREESPFPVDGELNKIVHLWSGDIALLKVDAIVNTTNESMTDRTGQSSSIIEYAGEELLRAINMMAEGCRTGEVRVTKGYNLPCKYIFHTMGPRYKEHYRMAAENALHNSYRNSLQELAQRKLKTVAFSVVHIERRGYPPVSGAHVALRTVRRFLEHNRGLFDAVIFVAPEGRLYDAYHSSMPLYFPRTAKEEKDVLSLLPNDIGNENGESVVEHRKVRIEARVAPIAVEKAPIIQPDMIDKRETAAFATMSRDQDASRVASQKVKSSSTVQAERDARWLLRAARGTDLSDIAAHNFIYESGVDTMGRTIVVVVGKWLPAEKVGWDRMLMYFVSMLEPIAQRDYVIVYCHGEAEEDNLPSYRWLLSAYKKLSRKARKNLKGVYILHKDFWFKMFTWFMTPFLSQKFWKKVYYIDRLPDIFNYFDQAQLNLPDHVYALEHRVHGYTVDTRGVRSHSEL